MECNAPNGIQQQPRASMEMENAAVSNLVKLFSNPQLEGYDRLKTASEYIDKFFTEIQPATSRFETMQFMQRCYLRLSSIEGVDPLQITRRICSRYEFYLKQKFPEDERFEKIASAPVDDALWVRKT